MKTKKNIQNLKKIFKIVSIYFFIVFLYTIQINANYFNIGKFADSLYTEEFKHTGRYSIDISTNSKNYMIKNFCEKVFENYSTDDWVNQTSIVVIKANAYKNEEIRKIEEKLVPSNSIFLYYLCNDIHGSKRFDVKTIKKYVNPKKYTYWNNSFWCNIKNSMLKCKLWNYTFDMIKQIMNELFNIKQSTIYWVKTDNLTDNETGINISYQINNYTEERFFGTILCDKNWEFDKTCNYPKTYRKLKTFQKKSYKLLNSLNLIKKWELIKRYKYFQKKDLHWETIEDDSFLFWLLWEDYSFSSFNDIIFNELFFYNLFQQYYIDCLSYDPKNFVYTTNWDNLDKKYIIAKTEMYEIEKNIWKINQTTKKTMDWLLEIKSSFPIHIGFLMYYEDLFNIRKNFVKTLTPMYTLYNKLQNVQKAF